jgi:peptide methionine sulfoxide reductase MsrB
MATNYRKAPAVARLSAEQRRVTHEGGTEPALRNQYWGNKEPGIYVDVVSRPNVQRRSTAAGGLRFCMSSASLRFVPVGELDAEGFGARRHVFGHTQATS